MKKKLTPAVLAVALATTILLPAAPAANAASSCTVSYPSANVYSSPSESSTSTQWLNSGDKWDETWWTVAEGSAWSQGSSPDKPWVSGWVKRAFLSC
ncbi:hypothetical protein FK268_09245 [Tsukamurella sputi]|uniref:Uncharacterized protein n=1 Tax=Tsukamurella sputi TaxID=2591848 RepID=A0A5C5RTH5_9ACTN|nr:hypothetical protein [Tsukamurella sputi]TWS25365.1 hypothetical protein FK268_09245 [Tsukamurella sputi]